jgi:hypothetical protein
VGVGDRVPEAAVSDDLYAVCLDKGGVLCASCGEERYPEDVFPVDATPVYESDGWKGEIHGTCTACGTPVGDAEGEP